MIPFVSTLFKWCQVDTATGRWRQRTEAVTNGGSMMTIMATIGDLLLNNISKRNSTKVISSDFRTARRQVTTRLDYSVHKLWEPIKLNKQSTNKNVN